MIAKRLEDWLPPYNPGPGESYREVNGETPRAYAIRRAAAMGFNAFAFLGSRRDRVIVNARTVIARELIAEPWGLTFSAVGRAINRHHTSVMNLCGAFDWDDTRLKNGRFARALHVEADRNHPRAAPRAGESGERSLRR